MRLVLRYGNKRTVEGILLAGSREHMRVVVEGKSDTVELVRVDGLWRADGGEIVELEAITAIDGVSAAEVLAAFAPRTMTAGGSWF